MKVAKSISGAGPVLKTGRVNQCRVIFLHRDEPSARQAAGIHEHLQRNLVGDCLLIASEWSFAEAISPKACVALLDGLRTADIVTLATRDDCGIPESILNILRLGWCHKSGKPAALALLVGRTQDDPRRATELILSTQALAQTYGLNFFPSEFDLSTCTPTKSSTQPTR